jgi:hypothetical protein
MRCGGVAAALFAVAVSYGAALAAPAKAPSKAPAQPSPSVNELPMQVFVVRSAEPGCEPNCAEWIAAQGQIESSTPRKFKKVFAQIGKRRLPVLIHSIGGSVDESLAIGRLIRAKGLEVAVTKTELLPCAANDKPCQKLESKGSVRGRPVAYHSICAASLACKRWSACIS